MTPRAELKTARLTLRPVAPEDEGVVVAVLNDLDVTGWLAVVPWPYSPADFHQFRTDYAVPGQTFAVEDAEGLAGIVGIEDRTLGYWYAPRIHGLGYATEAARAALAEHFAQDSADIASGYFEGNARSANVLGKLGFVAVGRGDKYCRALNADRPHIDMSLTRDAFVAALPIEARSARLTYRSWQATDFAALHALNSDWEVVRQLGSWPWPPEPDFTASRATPWLGRGFAWAVLLEGRIIGGVSVTDGIIGYSCARSQWRRGLGHEAAATAIASAFSDPDLPEITASVWADNAASLGLLGKLGFAEVSRTVEMSKARKVETDLVHLALRRPA